MRKAFSSSSLLVLQHELEGRSLRPAGARGSAAAMQQPGEAVHASPSTPFLRFSAFEPTPESPRKSEAVSSRTSTLGAAARIAICLQVAVLACAAAAWLSPRQSMVGSAVDHLKHLVHIGLDAQLDQAHSGCSKDIPTIHDFELRRLVGQWHQVAWLPGTLTGDTSKQKVSHCLSCNLTGNSSRNFQVTFTSMKIPPSRLSSGTPAAALPEIIVQRGVGVKPDGGDDAKLRIRLDTGHVLPLWVIDTDYTSWALFYSCSMQLGSMIPDEVFIVMSRSQSLGPMDVGDRLNQLAGHGLPWKNVVYSPAFDCVGMLA